MRGVGGLNRSRLVLLESHIDPNLILKVFIVVVVVVVVIVMVVAVVAVAAAVVADAINS